MSEAYKRPRYQVSVYRTIGPLVILVREFKPDRVMSKAN